jgi:hypothetical protein
MMDNLARIISHGFAVVVVILLGIGFIYRGELFPDLELPDFLVPSSEKMADAGDHRDKARPGIDVTQETTAHEPVAAVSSAPAEAPEETSAGAPEAPEAPEARVESPAAAATSVAGEETLANPDVEEAAETGMVTETVVETLQAPAEEISSPPAEEGSGTDGGAALGETGSAVTAGAIPPPVSPEDTPVEPQVAVPDTAADAQPAAVPEETSSESGTAPETVPQTDSPTPVAAPDEEPAPPAETAVPESPPVTATEVQPGVSGAAQSTPAPTSEVKPYELLAAAREAFWLHNYDDAEKNYRALTELEPQNPDGFGELGNMYFSQGRWEEAAAAYFEAGTRLISEGRLDPARELVNVIRGLNGQQADELNTLITSAESTGSH